MWGSKIIVNLYPDYITSIYEFCCTWSKAVMFSEEEKTDYKNVDLGLNVNRNHTSLRACCFI